MNNLIILHAANYAAQKHAGQKRKGAKKEPYINHTLEVADLIAQVGKEEDDEILAAAILHDTLEDTDATEDEIRSLFGERVLHIVNEVTDNKSLPKKKRKQLQIDHAHELSREATLIKIADKTSNVKDITYSPPKKWSKKRRKEYLQWAEKVIGNCNPVNEALKAQFTRILEKAKTAIV